MEKKELLETLKKVNGNYVQLLHRCSINLDKSLNNEKDFKYLIGETYNIQKLIDMNSKLIHELEKNR